MSLVHLRQVSFSYDNWEKSLLSEVTLSFYPGWTSICGANGSGKTTLCKLISGVLLPSSGILDVQGTVYIVPQETEVPPPELETFRSTHNRLGIRLQTEFGIDAAQLERWDSLSMGERKKIQLMVALAQEPAILVVDEPTNHVDCSAPLCYRTP